MRAIVFGGSGFLGQHVVRELTQRGLEVEAPSRQQLDLTDYARLREFLTAHPCQFLFNCAACTDLEYCEHCPPRAAEINWLLPGLLVHWSRASLRMVHVTTDYAIDPVQEYGRQKLRGEDEFFSAPYCTGIRLQVRIGGLYDADRGLPAKIMRATPAQPIALIDGDVGFFMPADWAAAQIVGAAIDDRAVGRTCLSSCWQNPWRIGCELRGADCPAIVRMPVGRCVHFPARPTHGNYRDDGDSCIGTMVRCLTCTT